MKNIHSTSGYLEDTIRSIVQLICSEGHYKTMIEKLTSELDNGIIETDDPEKLNTALDKLDHLNKEMDTVADTRRKMMVYLYEQGTGDKEYWCLVKHHASAAYTAFEAWQGSDNDARLYEFSLETQRQFITALTHFLGIEITSCASCFSDMLKGGIVNEKEHKKN